MWFYFGAQWGSVWHVYDPLNPSSPAWQMPMVWHKPDCGLYKEIQNLKEHCVQ